MKLTQLLFACFTTLAWCGEFDCSGFGDDTDNDGIKDHLDQCPASPPGATVNGYGCADSEWDSDEDDIDDE